MHHYNNYKDNFNIGTYLVSNVVEKYESDIIEINLEEFKNVNVEISLAKELIYQDSVKQNFSIPYLN